MNKPANEIGTMAELRAEIDALDNVLIELLARRMRYIDRAPALKMRQGIAANAPSRVADVVGKVRAKAAMAGFDPDLAETMWQVMIDAMIAREERVMGTKGADG